MESAPPKIRSRQCMFVLYPESQQRAIEYAQKNFPCAWALHDKDVHAEKDYSKYLDKYGEPPEWKAGVSFQREWKNGVERRAGPKWMCKKAEYDVF